MKVRLRGAGVDGTLSLTVPNDCSLEGLEQAAAEHGACALPTPTPTKALAHRPAQCRWPRRR